MSQPAVRELTADMICGNLLSHRCVMAAVFQAEVLLSVSLRVFEPNDSADPEISAHPDCPALP